MSLSPENQALIERVLGRPDQFPQGERELHSLLDAARAEGPTDLPKPDTTTPDTVWIWFADTFNIRKWSSRPFPMGGEYRLSQRPAAVGGGKEDHGRLPPTPMPIGGE